MAKARSRKGKTKARQRSRSHNYGTAKARSIHNKRSLISRRTDEALLSTITNDVKKWMKRKNRLDMRGIDAPTSSTRQSRQKGKGKRQKKRTFGFAW